MDLPTFDRKLPRFRYIGSNGPHIPHTVISGAAQEVVTWSDPDPDEENGGWSWMGPLEDFRKEFEACA